MAFHEFELVSFLTVLLWTLGTLAAYFPRRRPLHFVSNVLVIAGIVVLLAFTAKLWIQLERPPLRTLAETRLWYAILLSIAGLTIRMGWQMVWLQTYSLAMAILFLLLNILNPEVFDRTLMPALQSPWFVPHVVVYLEAYALLAAAFLVALRGLFLVQRKEDSTEVLSLADSIVYAGYAFLTFGLLFGALWAKTAWGHYWSWDPKETWALLTWLAYLFYLHLRHYRQPTPRLLFCLLAVNFVVVLLCWFGVNYLPTTQYSVHTYSG